MGTPEGTRRSVGRRAMAAALVLLGLPASGLAAQTVMGVVLDGDSGEPIAGASVTLLAPEEVVLARTETGRDGRFILPARAAGIYAVTAERLGYAPARSDSLALGIESMEVELRLFRSPLELAPLTVVARRRDGRHDASFEGALIRHALFPRVGSRRVVFRGDPEFRSSIVTTDVLRWFTPRRGCTIVWAGGLMARSRNQAEMWLSEVSTEDLEAVEFYRSWADAPVEMKDFPSYVDSPSRCSVVAVWPRLDPPPARIVTAGHLLGAAGVIGFVFLLRSLLVP